MKALRNILPAGTEIWAVGAVGTDDAHARPGADRTLFDTKVDGSSGGTGQVFDWSRIRDREDLSTSILAGGLAPGNAAQATRVGAYALDVSSGVEAAPGRKDPAKLLAFFDALRVPVRKDMRP
jgi:indole-3-glycerol phosphate synthase/phosphoribosylanthranilate isomerase